MGKSRNPDASPQCPTNAFGHLAMLLQFFEQNPLWNALNHQLPHSEMTIGPVPNYTLRMTAITTFLCPSDPTPPVRSDLGPYWAYPAGFCPAIPGTVLPAFDTKEFKTGGISCYVGMSGRFLWYQDGRPNGAGGNPRAIYEWETSAPVRISSVTDGTSNTIAYTEKSPSLQPQTGWISSNNGWCLSRVGINLAIRATGRRAISDPEDTGLRYGPNSWHPGGCNFAFVDGSVKFLKETINIRTFEILSEMNDGGITSADSY